MLDRRIIARDGGEACKYLLIQSIRESAILLKSNRKGLTVTARLSGMAPRVILVNCIIIAMEDMSQWW